MSGVRAIASKISPAQEHAVNPDALKTSIDNGIAVVTLGSANRIFLDQEMTDALTTALEELAGDPGVRVVVLTGGAPGYFIRHYSITSLLRFAEAVRSSGREWADNATYHGGFIDRAIGLCETMAKPTIAEIRRAHVCTPVTRSPPLPTST